MSFGRWERGNARASTETPSLECVKKIVHMNEGTWKPKAKSRYAWLGETQRLFRTLRFKKYFKRFLNNLPRVINK